MRTVTLTAGLLTAALLLPAAQATAESRARPSPAGDHWPRTATVKPRSDRWEERVVALTNTRRRAHGRTPLKAAACADKYAEPWTRHLALAQQQVLEHQDLTPVLSCPHTSYAGENIAFGYETPRALVRAWMHSSGHRANILSRHFDRIGVAGWRATNGVTYATQDFLG